MPLRPFATGLWLAATVGSTGMVWKATSVVAADVTDRPAPVVGHQDVVNALQSNGHAANLPSALTTPTAVAPSPAAVPTIAPLNLPPSPIVTLPTVPATTTSTAAAAVTTTTRPKATTTTLPPNTAAYSTTGGVVTITCYGPFNVLTRLVSATPNDGYAVLVTRPGPDYVEIHFTGKRDGGSVVAFCGFGRPARLPAPPAPNSTPAPTR